MTFDQEAHPRLQFEHNALKVVVAQVRFPTVYLLGDPAVQARVQAAFAASFPNPLPPVQEILVTLTPRGPEQIQAQQGGAIRFADAAGRSIVSVDTSSVSLETSSYPGWEAFSEQLWSILRTVMTHGQPAGITRLGLRYVDEIAIDGLTTVTDWARAIQASLLGTDDSMARDERVVRTQQRVTIAIGDDVVNVVHGFVRNLAAEALPSSVYTIDSDVFTEVPQAWDLDALRERAERYHQLVTNVFVRSLTPEGIRLMGGTER